MVLPSQDPVEGSVIQLLEWTNGTHEGQRLLAVLVSLQEGDNGCVWRPIFRNQSAENSPQRIVV